jgi:hypothetical protein
MTVDGYLRYFENPDALEAKKTLFVPQDVIAIKVGRDVDRAPPPGNSAEHMIKIVAKQGSWVLCADSLDEML